MQPWISFIPLEGADLGDWEFLRDKELLGDLIHLLSSEFTGNAAQITYVPANGQTFFHMKSKLYPVTDVVVGAGASITTITRRADVELEFDSVLKDVLTYSWVYDGAASARAGAGNADQKDTNIFESMVGNGSKAITLTSTNNSGTYRVSMLGWIQDT